MRRSKKAAQETKLQLIEAACKVFYQEGVARATLEQIAREAGVTRGALYWHFNNKVDILDAVFQTVMPHLDELDEHVNSFEGAAYWHALEGYYINFFEHLNENVLLRQFCAVMHLKCEMTESNGQVVALLERYRHSWVVRIQEVVKKAVLVGALPVQTDTEGTAMVLRSFLVGIMGTYLAEFECQVPSLGVPSPTLQLQYVFRMLQERPLLQASCNPNIAP